MSDGCRSFYSQVWGPRLSTRGRILDFVHSAEGIQLGLLLQPQMIETAFSKIKNKRKLDRQFVCVDMLMLIFEADPERFTSWLQACLASTTAMSDLQASCTVFGKKSSKSCVHDLRCIVPMSSILVLVDRVLSLSLEPILDNFLPITLCIFVGGRRFTQTLHIGHAVALIIEIGLDNESNAVVAQADIRSYFDDLLVWKITRWLLDRGCPLSLLAAVLRFQILTKLVLFLGCSQAEVRRRSSGGLTGSTVALLLSRVPVESTMLELEQSI